MALLQRISLNSDYSSIPLFFGLRSHTLFIIATVGIGLFTDLFLYGLVVPVLPFVLTDRVGLPREQVQAHVSALLAAYAAASVVLSPFAGAIADRTSSRQLPFLAGLTALILATILLFTGSTVPVLTIARIFQGASSAFVWTIGLALCIDTVGPENLGKTIGSIFSFISVGELFAPVIGGVLYQKSGLPAVAAVALTVLAIDFLMRLLVIEKKVAARYIAHNPTLRQKHASDAADGEHTHTETPVRSNDDTADEESPLLGESSNRSKEISDDFAIPQPQPYIIRKIPILYCLSSPSLILALVVALVQASLLAAFDSTIPTHASDLYNYDSLKSSLLFVPLGIFNLIFGPLAGWAVDKYGTKPAAVAGYAYLVPVLALLRLPVADPQPQQPLFYAGLLALCGVGLATIGSPSIVEAGSVVEQFHKKNPGVFGEQGPYAQLYGLNSMVFSFGLSVGPVLAGGLKEMIGYGNMNAVMAGVSGVTATCCYIWLGGKPKGWAR
ncbi:MAG: hypothetical protein Q9162_001087 [Coniocarpon cinnabarinum]